MPDFVGRPLITPEEREANRVLAFDIAQLRKSLEGEIVEVPAGLTQFEKRDFLLALVREKRSKVAKPSRRSRA